MQSQLRWCFDGFEVHLAEDRRTALNFIQKHRPHVITLDLGLPPDPGGTSEGMALLKEALATAPYSKIIVVTGHNDMENSIRAVGLGAYDFYQKPIDHEVLRFAVDRAHRLYELEAENRRLLEAQVSSAVGGIVTDSDIMLDVCRTIEKVGPADITVLLLGDSGTGKELLARRLHDSSPRKDERFVAVNCAAIPENLLESELFGYEKGAFTGANKRTIGVIESADAGTLFFDEIGDLSLPLQAKLLRFLQERSFERVGGRESIPVDVRVVCATHRDLNSLMASDAFREDLYFRLSEIAIDVPPLSARSGDSLLLAHYFLGKFTNEHGRTLAAFSDDAMSAIEQYSWPGNVRELENKIKRAVIMAEGKHVTALDIGLPCTSSELPEILDLRFAREQAEKKAIKNALVIAQENMTKTAHLLGVTRPTLYTLIEKYDLKT